MGGIGVHGIRAERRSEPSRLADLLQRISSALIRAPHERLPGAIESALSGLGDALGADLALVVTRGGSRIAQQHFWERSHQNGVSRPLASDPLPAILAELHPGKTLVCSNRKQFPGAAAELPAQLASGIFVPLHDDADVDGNLAVLALAPRSWSAEAIDAAERVADMLSAGLDRMATRSTLTKEQDARLHAEAETRTLRDQLAHSGRVSMLGELAASLAHELNQPLTAIYTNAQAAHRFLDRKRPALDEARGALHDLGQDCRRAGDVLGRIRQMFRRHETERVPLSVGALIEHMLRLLHEDAVSRGVTVVLDVAPGLPPVNGDRVQLEQVVMNLLVNAFDAVTAVDGPREVKVRARARGELVDVAVLDTGKGIARGDLERVFEPFFTRKPNGMGMGLAISRTIVEAHGGRIAARHRAERGTMFELSLPAAPAAVSTKGGLAL